MISAYIKPTNYCNVGCAHCYLPEEVRANKDKMSPQTLHTVMKFLKDMQQKARHNAVFMLWHGGEPLVLSADYFFMAGEIIDSYFPAEQRIEAVQTSLIPYRREHAPVVKQRWRGEIGSSIDFNSRLIKDSVQEYQKLWMLKVDMARSDDILVIPGMVPNKKDCQNAGYIYQWFIDHDFWVWNIDRYSNVAKTLPDFSTNREHSRFLIELFDLTVQSIARTGCAPFIKPIGAAIGGILHDSPGDRWGGSCQSDFVVINPDGRLNNCPDKDSFEDSYGSLFEGYDSFANAPLRKKWIRIQQSGHRIDECYSCENASWCKSGCPITGNACHTNGSRDDCSGYKDFLNHVRAFLAKDSSHQELLEKYLAHDFIPQGKINNDDSRSLSHRLLAN